MEDNSGRETSVARTPSGRLESEETRSVQGYISIKGTRSGLLLTLEPETPFIDLLNALADRLSEAPAFFRGAALTVDTSRRNLRVSERVQLENLLAHYQMSVRSLEQVTEVIKEARTITLPLEESPAEQPNELQIQRDPRESEDTLFLRRTIRSGQAIHHKSNVVVSRRCKSRRGDCGRRRYHRLGRLARDGPRWLSR